MSTAGSCRNPLIWSGDAVPSLQQLSVHFSLPGAPESLSHNNSLQAAGYRMSGESFPPSIQLLFLSVQTKLHSVPRACHSGQYARKEEDRPDSRPPQWFLSICMHCYSLVISSSSSINTRLSNFIYWMFNYSMLNGKAIERNKSVIYK